ncbi:MAG TPA: TerC family protein [Gemmatimonadales bacterium]|nr:TerC family protein [Gemmatimonadales bacterium]
MEVPTHEPWVWGGFTALVLVLLVLDLAVLNRRSHVLTIREASTWSAGLISLALLFGLFLLWREGTTAALEYYSGYLIELSLSVDNLFVFLLIFQYFAVPAELQPRVLKWGIMSAIVLRGVMITLGALLLERFHWIIYVFGAILFITGIRMMRQEEIRVEPERNPLVKLVRRFFPVTPAYEDAHFFVKPVAAKRWIATPLLLVLVVVEWSDIVFAIDSIPAIFAVTRDPFIVYSSNVFAILGLRALYFVLAGAMDRFHYLKPAVAGILVFVGVKMVVSGWIKVATPVSLAVIVGMLALGIAASLIRTRREAVQGEGG